MVKSVGSRIKLGTQLHHLLAAWFQASYLTSLNLYLFVCEMPAITSFWGFEEELSCSSRIAQLAKKIRLLCRRSWFNSWVGKIPWRRERLLTTVFWPGEFHGLSSPWSHKELDMTERLTLSLSLSSVELIFKSSLIFFLGFPCGSAAKESTCNAGDLGSIPGLGRSPGEGKGYSLQ